MILLPNANGTIHPTWVDVGAGISDQWEALVDDNGSTSYVKCSTDAATMVIEFADPSVAESGIDFNETVSVRFLSSGKSIHRVAPSIVDIAYETPSITAESCSYNAHRTNYETINGTAQTTTDGSTDWTYLDLERLEMVCTKDSTIEVYLSYLALEVTYTEAVSADNATFFGANF